jgi:pilus assembly protein CpaB
MRAKSLVLLLIAGVCGLVASIGISQVIDRKGNTGEAPMGELFVAVTDIDIAAKLDATNVKLDKWPKDRIPEGAITKLEDLKDKFPRTRLFAGEPILAAKLMDTNSGIDNSAKIPDGYRVVSVKVSIDEVVSGLVKPGDRVDVIVFLKEGQGVLKTMSHTILRDVRVFAVNSETERSTDTSGEQVSAKTVSLLVKPKQVESVNLAAELGKLRLSLRRPNDTKTEGDDDEGTDIDSLLSDGTRRNEKQKAHTESPAEPQGGIYDLLNKAQPTPAAVASAPVGEPVPEKPAHTMTILTPGGSQEFQWMDPKKLPTTVGGSSNSSGSSSPGGNANSLPLAAPPTIKPEPATPSAPASPGDEG